MDDFLDKYVEKINAISTMTNVKEIMNYIEVLLTQRISIKVDQRLIRMLCDLLDLEYKNFTNTVDFNSKLFFILKSLRVESLNSRNVFDLQKIYYIFINICLYIYSYCYMIDKLTYIKMSDEYVMLNDACKCNIK